MLLRGPIAVPTSPKTLIDEDGGAAGSEKAADERFRRDTASKMMQELSKAGDQNTLPVAEGVVVAKWCPRIPGESRERPDLRSWSCSVLRCWSCTDLEL